MDGTFCKSGCHLLCRAMVTWLSPSAALLDADRLVALDYTAAATLLPSFACAAPYGTPALPGARVRCKRKRTGDSVRAAREEEGEARHALALPAMLAALAFYESHVTVHGVPGTLPAAPAGDESLPALVEAVEAGESSPLLLLSPGGSAPLIGCVHANMSTSVITASLSPAQVFLLPPSSRFAVSSASALPSLLPELGSFSLLILDPPWESVSPTRGSTYAALSPNALAALPVRQLCAPGGALVAIWVTNRERVRRLLHDRLLPAWGLTPVAEWHWLKVTADGRPVLPLLAGSGTRRPYEVLVLAWYGAPVRAPPAVTLLCQPGQHSRKPRLHGLLRPHAPAGAALELFAREVAAGATAWGNEPLRFQAAGCFAEPAESC